MKCARVGELSHDVKPGPAHGASDAKVRDAVDDWIRHLEKLIVERATEMPEDEGEAATNRMLCMAWKSTLNILKYVLDGRSSLK